MRRVLQLLVGRPKQPPTRSPREASVQATVLRFLRLDRRVAWVQRFNTGAHATEHIRPNGRRTKRFIRYAFPGCADLLGQLRDGRFLAVEVKTRTGRVSPAQQAFLATVAHNGGVALVARSVEDVSRTLDLACDADAGRRRGALPVPALEKRP